jgi:hypothetical protein
MEQNDDAPREKRLRKLVQKRGYALRKNRSRSREHPGYGKFMIVDTKDNAAIAGHMPFPFSYDLDQVEAWLGRHEKEQGPLPPVSPQQQEP